MPIRSARPGDATSIHDLVRAAYAPYAARIGKPPGPVLDDHAARIARGEAWVLEEAGRVVGVLVLVPGPERLSDGPLLDNLAVHPDAQGRGHGRALLRFAEDETRRRGLTRLRLYTHASMHENRALYRRFGFEETGRGMQDGYDRVFMAKPLRP